jgi:high-affinity Fe2+/Pb2+ permease
VATVHDQHTRTREVGTTSSKRWILAIAVIVMVAVAITLLIVYGGGSGSGGTGGY